MRKEKPEVIGWGITRNCNLSCPHCYTASTHQLKNELTTDECLKLVDSMINLEVSTIGWTGGEPLLREDLEEIIIYAKSKGNIRSGITTNGILLDEKRGLSLKKAGVGLIQISLDGSTPQRNAWLRKATEEDFYSIIDAIRICQKLGFRLELAMVLGVENLEDGPDFIKFAQKEEVSCVRFCGFVPFGRGKNPQIIKRLCFNEDSLPSLKRFFKNCLNGTKPMVMPDPGFGPLPPDYYTHPCVSGVKTFYLNSTGDVYPCTTLLDNEFLVGNVRKKSLEEIWVDSKMTFVSNFPYEKIKGYCVRCEFFPQCHGGCRGITFAHTGDLFASFPLCLKRVKG
jgi:radical SAM protein with 4Fe4S-binding SPASM domain